MQNDHLCACSFGGSVVSLKQRMRHSGREAVPQKLVWNIKEVLFVKHFISRRNFLKAAGVTAAASAMAAAVPQASAGFLTGKDAAVTILYTNDVHTYIDNKSPKLTYAAIAAMKQGYVDEGKPVLLVDAGDHIQGTAYGSMDDGATIIELMNEAGYDIATLGNHEFDYGMARAKAIIKEADFPMSPATGWTCAPACVSCPLSSCSPQAASGSHSWASRPRVLHKVHSCLLHERQADQVHLRHPGR